jgi:hypothetical protein
MQPEGAVNNTEADNDAAAATIEARFGGRWGIWLSDAGYWWAARRAPLTSEDLNAGCVPFIRASSPGELTRLVQEQERLQAIPPTTAGDPDESQSADSRKAFPDSTPARQQQPSWAG